MSFQATPQASSPAALEQATRVAVVAALSATAMLFASLASAYLVRRSFTDWRPTPGQWPVTLMALALLASTGIEVASRSTGAPRRRALMFLVLLSGLYLVDSLAVMVSVTLSEAGLTSPYNAFVVLLLSVHVAHASLGAAFSAWAMRRTAGGAAVNGLVLPRLVIHFLAALLLAIAFLLRVLQ